MHHVCNEPDQIQSGFFVLIPKKDTNEILGKFFTKFSSYTPKNDYSRSLLNHQTPISKHMRSLSLYGVTTVFILLLAFNTHVHSQSESTSVCFTYDQNGNRIKREICNIDVVKADSSDTTLKRISEKFLNFKLDTTFSTSVSVFPNPTNGQLIIVFNGVLPVNCAKVWIYTLSGQEIGQNKLCEKDNKMDMSSYPEGIYFLLIQDGTRSGRWKIIMTPSR